MLAIVVGRLRHLLIPKDLILMATNTLGIPRLAEMAALEVRRCMNMDGMFVERCTDLLSELMP